MMLEGGTTFCWIYMQKFRSMWLRYQVEKEFIKMAGNKNETCNFGPFTGVNKYLSFGTISYQLAVLTPNEVGL